VPAGSISAPLFGIGHNQGPPLDPGASWRLFCWKNRRGSKVSAGAA
jgi:hypothetical protein